MANPLRFIGSGEFEDIDNVILPPRCPVEVTFRAHQQRLLLRPDDDANQTLLGCFGRAYHRYPGLNLHALDIKSNHGCFLASPTSAPLLSDFMRDFLSTSGRRLNLLRNRDGTFWERRFRAIPVLDEETLEERLAYVLLQGTKENLLWSPRDWPGISSVRTLMGGPEMVGRWRDGTTEGRLKRNRKRKLERAAARGREIDVPLILPVYRDYPIVHHPLQHWADLPVGKQRARIAEIVRADEKATRARHKRDGTRPLGVRAILRQDPFSRPRRSKKSPAPRCHTRSKARRAAFRALCRRVNDERRLSTERLRTARSTYGVVPDATVPPLAPRNHRVHRPHPPLVYEDGTLVQDPHRDTAPEPRAVGPPSEG